jgi:putative transposase
MDEPINGQVCTSTPQSDEAVAELPLSHSIPEIGSELAPMVQQRLDAIQLLLRYEGTEHYRKMQSQVAQSLGISLRSLQRLVKAWRDDGIRGLSGQPRRDRGAPRISEDWQGFILKTYRDGNRGSRQMSPLQVAVRIKVRAQEMGIENYPSHMTVYRLLNPLIKKAQKSSRAIVWKGSRLTLKTREGSEIAVEWSNQVWQVDHTLADVLVIDQTGTLLGRPWLTIVVDTYSRCIMGMHLGFDPPSAQLVCLALRHGILPKQYPVTYKLQQDWGTYGLPQILQHSR